VDRVSDLMLKLMLWFIRLRSEFFPPTSRLSAVEVARYISVPVFVMKELCSFLYIDVWMIYRYNCVHAFVTTASCIREGLSVHFVFLDAACIIYI
jgi:hypothetical protein